MCLYLYGLHVWAATIWLKHFGVAQAFWCLQETHLFLLLLKCMRFWLLKKVNLKLNTSKKSKPKGKQWHKCTTLKVTVFKFHVWSHVFSGILVPTGSLCKPGWFVLEVVWSWENDDIGLLHLDAVLSGNGCALLCLCVIVVCLWSCGWHACFEPNQISCTYMFTNKKFTFFKAKFLFISFPKTLN